MEVSPLEEGLIRSDRLAPMQATSQVQTAGQSGLEFFSHSNNNKISFSLLFVLCIFWIYFFFFLKKKGGGKGRKNKIREKCQKKKPNQKHFPRYLKTEPCSCQDSMNSEWITFFFQFSTPIKILQKPLPSKHSSSRSNNLLPPSPSHVTFHKRIKGWALFLQTVSANERALLILVW